MSTFTKDRPTGRTPGHDPIPLNQIIRTLELVA